MRHTRVMYRRFTLTQAILRLPEFQSDTNSNHPFRFDAEYDPYINEVS